MNSAFNHLCKARTGWRGLTRGSKGLRARRLSTMSNRSITCRDFVASIDEYQGGEMAPRRRAIFADHLSQCDKCSAYLKSYITTVKLTKDAYSEDSDDTP